jgi:hypothetical protein
LSAYLDLESQLQQYITGENVVYDVCSSSLVEIALLVPLVTIPYTRSTIIQQKQRAVYLELNRYQENLLVIQRTCLLCRGLDEP